MTRGISLAHVVLFLEERVAAWARKKSQGAESGFVKPGIMRIISHVCSFQAKITQRTQ